MHPQPDRELQMTRENLEAKEGEASAVYMEQKEQIQHHEKLIVDTQVKRQTIIDDLSRKLEVVSVMDDRSIRSNVFYVLLKQSSIVKTLTFQIACYVAQFPVVYEMSRDQFLQSVLLSVRLGTSSHLTVTILFYSYRTS